MAARQFNRVISKGRAETMKALLIEIRLVGFDYRSRNTLIDEDLWLMRATW